MVNATGFRSIEKAIKEYAVEEERIEGLPAAEVVMVSAGSIDEVVRGYPSYFIDTKQFLDALRCEVTS